MLVPGTVMGNEADKLPASNLHSVEMFDMINRLTFFLHEASVQTKFNIVQPFISQPDLDLP